jgi:hypothetical protein
LTPEQNTRHLFVETNWLHEYAAPAHHKVPAAVTLLEKAQRGDFILHIPNVSFAEARLSIQTKCQPTDGPGIHRYIRWAHKNGELNYGQADDAHRLAESYVPGIRKELSAVPSILKEVAGLSCVKMFAFDEMPGLDAVIVAGDESGHEKQGRDHSQESPEHLDGEAAKLTVVNRRKGGEDARPKR